MVDDHIATKNGMSNFKIGIQGQARSGAEDIQTVNVYEGSKRKLLPVTLSVHPQSEARQEAYQAVTKALNI